MTLGMDVRWWLTIRLLRCVAALVAPIIRSLSGLLPADDSDDKRL